MRTHRVYGVGFATLWSLGVALSAACADEKPVAKCPVRGEPANLAVSTPTDDGPVFFCCKKCIKRYAADPDKFAKVVAQQRKALAKHPKVQVTCPVSGNPVDQKVYTEHKGRKVYFCCPDCIPKFEADPGKFKRALANSYTYQTRCPVSGEPINPEALATLKSGEKIHFCCNKCKKKLLSDPARYASKLEAQGLTIDPEKIKESR